MPEPDAGPAGKRAFLNLNTVAELRQAERILAAGEAVLKPAGQHSSCSSPPLVCFVGKKNSGKTTFLAGLVSLLSSRGLAVAYVKHDVHGFTMDHVGTDTWQLAQAGAREVVISSPESCASIRQTDREPALEEICAGLGGGADIVIAEGFKSSEADRIEISRRERSETLACRKEDLLAVVSDHYRPGGGLPVFGLEDIAGVADFLTDRYQLAAPAGRGASR